MVYLFKFDQKVVTKIFWVLFPLKMVNIWLYVTMTKGKYGIKSIAALFIAMNWVLLGVFLATKEQHQLVQYADL